MHGTGASVNGSGPAFIDGLIPNAFLTSVSLDAREDSPGHAGNLVAWLYAICAT